MKDLKYLIAYLVPGSALLGLAWQGLWSWLTVALVFGILPIIELFTPESSKNIPESLEESRSRRIFFDWLLYVNAPLLFGIVGWYLWTVSGQSLSVSEVLGLTLGAGIMAGAGGINVAHELGHRASKGEQLLAQIMLLPSLYQHFFVEHNRGHHKNVATDEDPASARLGENVFGFWFRSVSGGWRSAWALERERLAKAGLPIISWSNAMLRYSLFQTLWLGIVFYFFGWKGLLGALAVALVSFLLLETVNYIEHYGLRRKMLSTGKPEPVSPRHSWNSDHELGRIFLYELTRHSDHHYKSTRKYQILRHMDESPQLPFGYPTSIVLALVPPLWFRLMNHRALRHATASVSPALNP
jgi:alkane 1-monooxygenase